MQQKRNGALACDFEDLKVDGYTDLVCRYQNAATEGTSIDNLLDRTPIKDTDTFCDLYERIQRIKIRFGGVLSSACGRKLPTI